MGGLLTYYRFKLPNGNTVAIEATSRFEAREILKKSSGYIIGKLSVYIEKD